MSCYIAQFPEYFSAMMEHLVMVKLQHWEKSMRLLAAQSLSLLVVFNPQEFITTHMDRLLDLCFNKVVHVRHGAIAGLAEVLIGLSGNSERNRRKHLDKALRKLSKKEQTIIADSANKIEFQERYEKLLKENYFALITPAQMAIISSAIQKVEKERLYRGRGGEIVREAVCFLIKAQCIARVSLNTEQLVQLFMTIEENLRHTNPEVQRQAAGAFRWICETHLSSKEQVEGPSGVEFLKLIRSFFKPSTFNDNVAITRGYNQAFGILSRELLLKLKDELLDTVLRNCVPRGADNDDAETRTFAVASLLRIVNTLGLAELGAERVKEILARLYHTLEDYATDSRGDVGLWIREGGITTMQGLLQLLLDEEDLQLREAIIGADENAFWLRFFRCLVQQLVEKIDRMRQCAGRALQNFLKFQNQKLPAFPEKDLLLSVFVFNPKCDDPEMQSKDEEALADAERITYLPWRNAAFVFQEVAPLLSSEQFSSAVLKGIISSAGGITESTLKMSREMLYQHLQTLGNAAGEGEGLRLKKAFVMKLVTIFRESLKVERITVPMMFMIEALLASGYLGEQGLSEEFAQMHELVGEECAGSKNIVKVQSSVGVLKGILQYKELFKPALRSLLIMLFHSFPKVRKSTAEQLYTYLIEQEEVAEVFESEEMYWKATEVLSETNWTVPLKELSSKKGFVFGIFGEVPPPPKKKAPPKEGPGGEEKVVT